MHLSSILSELGLNAPASERAPLITVPRERLAEFADRLVNARQLQLSLMYATDEREASQAFFVHAVFAVDADQTLLTLRTELPMHDPSYPALTRTVMAAHWYERLMQDQFGLVADGHPDGRRLMHHQNIPAGTYPLRKDFAWNTRLAYAEEPDPMGTVAGKGMFEIPVGPIHAGIIEPGHFRFNVRGERIVTLEGKLFFTHKGVEKLLEGKTPEQAMPFIERVSGNMAVGHTLAFCEAIERIAGIEAPERARHVRTFLNELERVCMHVFDLGNIAGMGTGFTFMAAQNWRLVEQLRRLGESLTGHRFFRGLIVPGGLSRDVPSVELEQAAKVLTSIEHELKKILRIALASDALMERFETTGVLKRAAAVAYGAVGPAARASGVGRDVRVLRPYAAYDRLAPNVVTEEDGDVRARFELRVTELAEAFRILRACVTDLPAGPVLIECRPAAGQAYGWCEGWLGEILDWVRLDDQDRIERCVIRDPSFCNWALFSEIGPGNIVPDFPLCNKTLDLSYSGTDL